jgi:hypothetical protein
MSLRRLVGGLMKVKAITTVMMIAMIFGSSMTPEVALASGQSILSRKQNPVAPVPCAPTLPDEPGFPGFPGSQIPGGPTLPTLPTLPPPGKHNPLGGPEVPFPLSITLPFPWGNIEGMWKVVADNVEILFSFNVQTDLNGHQYLRVLQIDSASGKIIAEGVGIGVETDKLVRAAMTSKTAKPNYMLFIGSYKNSDQYVVGGQAPKTVTVLTVRPFTDLMGDKDIQAIVTKVSYNPFDARQCVDIDN